jgi:VanZ family protein
MDSHRRGCLAVVAWVVVIYTTIPFVRGLREWFIARWDASLIGWGVAAALVAAAAVAGAGLGRRPGGLGWDGRLWIAGAAVLLLVWTYGLRRRPEEAVHLLEYGLLAVLLHRALRPSLPDPSVFVAGALAGALVGTVDEVIQWLSPDRTWDWRDLAINGGAGALVQLVLWRTMPSPGRRPARRSVRVVLRLAAALLALLVLCLANTPRRVAVWAPALGMPRLTSSLNPMAEYGHRHRAPGLGAFASRLSLAEIEEQDRTRAAEVAAVLVATRHDYGRFLDTWPVADDPFAYEARVHLFSRDRNLAKAREAGFQGGAAREFLSVAWFENQLLEQYFGRTLAASPFRWGTRQAARADAGREAGRRLTSAVGSHLITFASEARLRAGLLAALALLVLADLALGRPRQSPRDGP